jgi:murein DD-endopeptidase MepM/ murein hydrolase activator NlpD
LALAIACGTEGSSTTEAWQSSSSSSAVDDGDTLPDSSSADTLPDPEGSTTTDAPDPDDTAAPPDVPPVDDCPRVRVVTEAGEVLNVRPDPSTANETIGTLPNNAIVEVIDEVQGEAVEGNTLWFHIAYLDGDGYVSGVFAECTLDDAPELLPPDGFWLPLECGMQSTVTQGNMGELSHNGLHAYAFDFGVPLDTPLVAMADGIVSLTFAETEPGEPCYGGGGPECGPFGNLVILLHGDGSTSLYKHLNAVQVGIGEFVPRGLPVGLSGSTGYSTGRHAHIMRMENCGELTCQSISLEFVEAGVPVTGTPVTSENCP